MLFSKLHLHDTQLPILVAYVIVIVGYGWLQSANARNSMHCALQANAHSLLATKYITLFEGWSPAKMAKQNLFRFLRGPLYLHVSVVHKAASLFSLHLMHTTVRLVV